MSAGVDLLIFQARVAGLPAPVLELMFHPRRRWRFDIAWPNKMIAVEVEGAVYANGRHTRGKGYEADCEKYNEAQRAGWKVYRFTTGQVESGYAIKFLSDVFEEV